MMGLGGLRYQVWCTSFSDLVPRVPCWYLVQRSTAHCSQSQVVQAVVVYMQNMNRGWRYNGSRCVNSPTAPTAALCRC